MTLTPRLSDPGASSSNTQQLAEQQQQHLAALVPQVAKDIEAVVKTAAMAASELPAEVRVPASKQAVDVLGVNSQDALLSSTSATNGHAANNEQFRQRRLSVTQVAMDEGARATQEAFTALFQVSIHTFPATVFSHVPLSCDGRALTTCSQLACSFSSRVAGNDVFRSQKRAWGQSAARVVDRLKALAQVRATTMPSSTAPMLLQQILSTNSRV